VAVLASVFVPSAAGGRDERRSDVRVGLRDRGPSDDLSDDRTICPTL